MTSRGAVTHFRQRVAEGHAEGLSLVVAPDVTLQAVLAAERLLAAVAGTVEGLLACGRDEQTGRDPWLNSRLTSRGNSATGLEIYSL